MDKPISVAYSPDTDDAFMVHAMKEGHIDTGDYQFEFISDDIQCLNQKALDETYDITAISIAVYPDIADKYFMMPVGASIGDKFGPALVTQNESDISCIEDLENKKIAVPGIKTSAFYAANMLLPNFEAVPMRFDLIESAIKTGKVAAGILIHELQLNYEDVGLKKVADLGALWNERYQLPLPLGANAIKKSLGTSAINELNQIYKTSIEWALSSRVDTIKIASQLAKAGLDDSLADKYISMYVNHRSLSFDDDVLEAIDLMYKFAAKKGFCPDISGKNILI